MKLVLASNNPGKLREFNALFSGSGIELLAQATLGIPNIEETGLSFVENALLKARAAAAHSGLPALADDSGICVDALDGAPGIRSARYAHEGATDAENVDKLLNALKDVPEQRRQGCFYCILACVRHANDPMPLLAEGLWTGQIAQQTEGAGGFGYDPVFLVPEHGCSSAQLPPETKNMLSHRGQALRKMRTLLEERLCRK
ncbi:MAG: RdgB/HAM1 family non-canonical purine NTP pyrophosphatase [Candidatus Eutrophobiaceae bacterium]